MKATQVKNIMVTDKGERERETRPESERKCRKLEPPTELHAAAAAKGILNEAKPKQTECRQCGSTGCPCGVGNYDATLRPASL